MKGQKSDKEQQPYAWCIRETTLPQGLQKWDSTFSVLVTIEQHYSAYDVLGGRAVSIDKYRARWDKYDNIVGWQNSKMIATCLGDFVDGGSCNLREERSVGTPSSGQWYDQYPSWRGRYVITHESAHQAGRADITLFRGRSTWALRICISQGGGSFQDC